MSAAWQRAKTVRGRVDRSRSERAATLPPDLDPDFEPLYRRAAPFTMTSVERLFALYEAVTYVERRAIPGQVVECGIWRGGSAMLAALTLLHLGDTDRALYLYDTFSGMPPPTPSDVDISGRAALDYWTGRGQDPEDPLVASASYDEVTRNLRATGFPMERVRLVPGRVEETLPVSVPEAIALLRLDTDWYESTLHELNHLYPRLSAGGVLIVDDYGHWQGARRAVDEYFDGHEDAPLLVRVDYTGRVAVKPRRFGTRVPDRGALVEP